MAPFTVAPASLGFEIVLVTTAIVAFFTLSGLALYNLRTLMASRRPVDVESATSQIQAQPSPQLGFNGPQTPLQHTLVRLNCVAAGVDPNAEIIKHSESGLIVSSSFEGWASSLCDLIEEFAGVERTTEPGLVTSSSFDAWAANLCDLISDFASPAPYRSGCTIPVDAFEDDPFIFDTMYKTPTVVSDILIPDIIVTAPSLPQIAEDTYHDSCEPALVTSPSFMDLAAECIEASDDDDTESTVVVEDNVETVEDISVALVDEPLDASTQSTQIEVTLSLSYYGSTLSTEIQTNASTSDNEEPTNDEHPHSKFLSPSSALTIAPVVEEPIEDCEPEETLKSVFESDSEDDETYYSRRPHLSRPKHASPSMSSILRNIVEKRKSQQSRRKESKTNKENGDRTKHSRRTTTSKHRFFSRTLTTPSEPLNPIKVPTIRFTPPTPPRRIRNKDNEEMETDSDLDEHVERVAFDVVFDDNGRFFF